VKSAIALNQIIQPVHAGQGRSRGNPKGRLITLTRRLIFRKEWFHIGIIHSQCEDWLSLPRIDIVNPEIA
jgi:hypothetical protein